MLAYLSSFLAFVCDINIAQHVDIDAVRAGSSRSSTHLQYMQTIDTGRILLRTLEVACQSLYDDASFLLSSVQSLSLSQEKSKELATRMASWDNVTSAITTNQDIVVNSLDTLLKLGLEQAELEQVTYNGAIEWRRSRPSVFYDSETPDFTMYQEEEDVVDIAVAMGSFRTANSQASSTLYNGSSHQNSEATLHTIDRSSRPDVAVEPSTPWTLPEPSSSGTLVGPAETDIDIDPEDDEFEDDGREYSHLFSPKPSELVLFSLHRQIAG